MIDHGFAAASIGGAVKGSQAIYAGEEIRPPSALENITSRLEALIQDLSSDVSALGQVCQRIGLYSDHPSTDQASASALNTTKPAALEAISLRINALFGLQGDLSELRRRLEKLA